MTAILAALGWQRVPASAQEARAQTPQGFFYPVGRGLAQDTNFGSCGGAFYPGTRHVGSDLGAEIGDPIYAVADGVVVAKSGPAQASGWGVGNYGLAVRHSSRWGDFIAIYGHIQTDLVVGSIVFGGHPLGRVGRYYEERTDARTGETVAVDYGPHLHFGIIRPGGPLPERGWGRLPDAGCSGQDATGNFLPPIAWLNLGQPVANAVNQPASPDAEPEPPAGSQSPAKPETGISTRPRVVGRSPRTDSQTDSAKRGNN